MRALSLRLGTAPTDVLIAVGASIVVALAMWRLGLELTVLAFSALILFVLAVLYRTVLCGTIIALSILPSLEALSGLSLPIGIEPLNVLVVMALGLALFLPKTGARSLWTRPIAIAIAVNILIYGIAWYRSYGLAPTAADIALLVKPAFFLIAGFVVARILPREELRPTVAIAMGVMFGLVALSILLQWLGIYQTSHQEVYGDILGTKLFGGLMLDGQTAGMFVGIYAVPTYLMLRSVGRPLFAAAVICTAFPILLVTLSRGGMVAFAVALAVMGVMNRNIMRTAILGFGIIGSAIVWAYTAGRQQSDYVISTFSQNAGDQNAQLSGREDIWAAAGAYLREEPSRWFTGGGLNDFREFALTSALGKDLPPHNSFMFCVVTGGVILALAFAWLLIELIRARGIDPSMKAPLRVTTFAFLAAGMSADITVFVPMAAWLALLAGTGYVLAADAAAVKRSAMAGTAQGRSRSRIASRTPGEGAAPA